MLLVNLLPAEFRSQTRIRTGSQVRQNGVKILGVLFVGLTLVLYVQYLLNLRTLKELKGRWPALQQEVQRIGKLRGEIDSGAKHEKEFLETRVSPPLRLTALLIGVSELIPEPVWLVELRMSREEKGNMLLVKGLSLPSKAGPSLHAIEDYVRGLKERLPAATNVILTTSRQRKENLELTLFTAVFKWV